MERLTKILENDEFYVDTDKVESIQNGYSGEAVNRLGKFENFYFDLLKSRKDLPDELQKLKDDGKEKSYRYKELMAKKFTINHVLGLLDMYDI